MCIAEQKHSPQQTANLVVANRERESEKWARYGYGLRDQTTMHGKIDKY